MLTRKNNPLKSIARLFGIAGLGAATLFATGCAANFGAISSTAIDSAVSGELALPTLQGKVVGGQNPLTGAVIQLYAAGTSGYGSTATALITGSTVTSNPTTGGFTITGTYSCPTGSYVYLTATGGDPGLGTGANSSIALMAALGSCSALAASGNNTFITINEVTTVAGVWAMQQFGSTTGVALSSKAYPATPSDSFGSSTGNQQGLINAMSIAGVLASNATGMSPGANTSGNQYNVEYWQINTIADILSACVNSSGASSTACSTLFSATGNSTDTLQAALYMAKNPTLNTSLTSLIVGVANPFVPVDTSTNDFTIGVSYLTGATPTRWIALDQFGNAWVATGGANVFELDPTGNIIATPTSYLLGGAGGTSTTIKDSYEVAVDTANNAWFTDENTTQAVFEVIGSTSAGGANGGAGAATATGSTATVQAIAVDGSNNVWTTSTSGHIVGFLKGAYETAVTGGTTTVNPFGMAIDLSNNSAQPGYTYSGGASFIYAVNNGGCANETLGSSTTANANGSSLDMDYTVAVGTATAGASTPLNYIGATACNTTTKVAPYLPAGATTAYNDTSNTYGIAVDNSNNLWVVNGNYVTSDKTSPQYSLSKITPNYSGGFTPTTAAFSFVNISGGGLAAPFYLAMDGASAAWTSNSTGLTNNVPGGTVSAFTNTGTAISPTAGLFGGVNATTVGTTTTTLRRAIIGARGTAVDGSGNVWVANTTTFTPTGATSAIGFVTVIVGAATPTVTPLSKGILNDTLASAPK